MADLNTQYRTNAQVHDALGQDIESLVRESDRNGLLVLAENAACHQDPAVSSSIFVTTATDVLGSSSSSGWPSSSCRC